MIFLFIEVECHVIQVELFAYSVQLFFAKHCFPLHLHKSPQNLQTTFLLTTMSSFTEETVTLTLLRYDSLIRQGLKDGNVLTVMREHEGEIVSNEID